MVASSSILVNVAEDAELRLVSMLGSEEEQAFQDTCAACINEGDVEKLIEIVSSSEKAMNKFLSLEADEAMAAAAVLATVLQKAEHIGTVSSALVETVIGLPGNDLEVTERKLKLLSVLYNMLPGKCAMLNRMIQLAGTQPDQLLHPESALGQLLSSQDSGFFSNVVSNPRIVTLLDAWEQESGRSEATITERRTLYNTICEVIPSTDTRRQRFLLLLLETYTDAKTIDAFGIESAKSAAIGAIRNPVTLFQQQRNILSQPVIQAMADAENGDLFSLLKIFQEGKLSDYEAFMAGKDETAILSQWGLEATACQRYMRILSLASLAGEHEEIPYSVIAETLKLPGGSSQVETWVIAAVNSGLLQAKMDQLAEKVMIERCVVRKFDMEQWKNLQIRLSLWKEHIGGMLETIKQSQSVATTLPANN